MFYYPGYVIRLYHNADVYDKPDAHALLCDLFCTNRDDALDLCDVTQLPGMTHNSELNASAYGDGLVDVSDHLGLVWRYLPMADPLVKEWHARDLDSR